MDPGVLADIILLVHAGFIGFVVLGLAATLVGLALRWRWVRNFWFRAAHLAAIGLVVLEAWLGVMCPLTIWESELRLRAGQEAYDDAGLIAHYLHQLLFFEADPWVFTLAYTLFGAAVVATFIIGPPRWPRRPERATPVRAVQ